MTFAGDLEAVEFRSHLRVLWRRKWTVLGVTLVLVATAVVLSLLQAPLYQGSVQVLLQQPDSALASDTGVAGDTDPARKVATEIEVIKSEPVRSGVRAATKLTVPKPSVTALGTSDVVEITVKDPDRSRAAVLASAYASSYLDYRRSQAIDDLNQAERKVQTKIADFQRQIDALDADRAASGSTGDLTTTRDQLVTQQALFKQRLDELQVDAELKTGGAQIVTRGVAPTTQVRPTPIKNGALALALGLGLGVGLAFLLEFLDDSIRTKNELERSADGLPVLGILPVVDGWTNHSESVVVSVVDPASPVSESYRSLRTSLKFLGIERMPQIFQITSAGTGDGKTTTTINLGVALARAGQRVVVVDCDLRRPRLHDFVDLPHNFGFTSVFVGSTPLAEAVQPVAEVDNLFLLASGVLPPNQSEVLGSRRTAEIFAELQEMFEVILIDCPPVLPVTDSSVLSAWVDATIVVARAAVTSRSDLRRALEVLRQVGAPLVGTVLNQAAVTDRYGYAYDAYRSKGIDDERREEPSAAVTSENGQPPVGREPSDAQVPPVDSEAVVPGGAGPDVEHS